MKIFGSMGKSQALKIGVIAIGLFISLGLMFHLGTVAAQQSGLSFIREAL